MVGFSLTRVVPNLFDTTAYPNIHICQLDMTTDSTDVAQLAAILNELASTY